MRAFACLCILMLSVQFMHAQIYPHIVKDYNNCTYGLQDGTGKWIAQPVYDRIAHFSGKYALAQRAGKCCLLNTSGRECIAPVWNDLKPTTQFSYCYVAYNNSDSSYVLDTTGRKLLAVPYRLSPYFTDSVSIADDAKGRQYLVHMSGAVVAVPDYVRQLAYIGLNLYSFTKDTLIPIGKGRTYTDHMKGVIHSTGKIIVPARFEKVKICHGAHPLIQTIKGKLCGYFALDGKEVWKCEYELVDNSEYLATYPLTTRRNGLWGAMRWDGVEAAPFICTEKPIQNQSEHYIVQVDSLFGFYHADSGYILPLEYSALFPGGYSQLLIGEKNNKWGCYRLDGSTVIPPEHDTAFVTANGAVFISGDQTLLIREWSDPSLIGITQEQFVTYHFHVTPYGDGGYYGHPDSIIAYNRNYERYYFDAETYYEEGEAEEVIEEPERKRKKDKKHKSGSTVELPYVWMPRVVPTEYYARVDSFGTNLPDYSAWYSYRNNYYYGKPDTLLLYYRYDRDTIHEIFTTGYEYADWSQPGYRTIHSGKKQGMIDKKGNIIIHPGVYTSITRLGKNMFAREDLRRFTVFDTTGVRLCSLNVYTVLPFRGDTVWVALAQENNYGTWAQFTKYALYDVRSQQFLTDTNLFIRYPFNYSDYPGRIVTSEGTGFMEPTTLQYIIPPVYNIVQPLDNTYQYYMVANCSNEIGIVDSKGVMVIDTAYREMVQIKSKSYKTTDDITTYAAGSVARYVLTQKNGEGVLFSTDGKIRQLDSAARLEVMNTVIVQTSENESEKSWYTRSNVYRKSCNNCPGDLFNPAGPLRFWQAHYLFGLMFLNSRDHKALAHQTSCQCCGYRYDPDAWKIPENRYAYGVYHIRTLGDSMMSYEFRFASNESYNEKRTVFLINNQVKTVLLDSLFTGTQWRQIVTDSVLSYLKQHREINADCSKPDKIPDVLNDRYQITSAGLELYPRWYVAMSGHTLSYTPVVFIPWSAIGVYLKPEYKTRLPY